ncbi:MAG: hypothetical protein M3070_07525, partial [Actinomycetota bacterium]|nr:hypothetical protein [Actinomycetota bacterium]
MSGTGTQHRSFPSGHRDEALRVALAQVDSRVGDLEHNVARARAAIEEAADGGAALIVLPELCLSGYAIGAIDRDLSLRADDPALAE